MPAASFVDSSHRVVITACSGEVTLDEIKDTFAEIQRHPEFHPDFQQLIDLSEASKCHLYSKDLYQFKHDDPFSNVSKRVVVAPDEVWFGIGRMYQLMLNSGRFEVVRSLPEAVTWLGLDASVVEAGWNQSTQRARSKKEHMLRDASDISASPHTGWQSPLKGTSK